MSSNNENNQTETRARSLSKLRQIGETISRALSRDPRDDGTDTQSLTSTVVNEDTARSVSRGRDGYRSSGRGGLGNIQQLSPSSLSTPPPPTAAPVIDRGRAREVNPDGSPKPQIYSVGRGGSGNFFSGNTNPIPLQQSDVVPELAKYRSVDSSPENSRSRSKSCTGKYSTGRGGAGNFKKEKNIDEDEVLHVQASTS